MEQLHLRLSEHESDRGSKNGHLRNQWLLATPDNIYHLQAALRSPVQNKGCAGNGRASVERIN